MMLKMPEHTIKIVPNRKDPVLSDSLWNLHHCLTQGLSKPALKIVLPKTEECVSHKNRCRICLQNDLSYTSNYFYNFF